MNSDDFEKRLQREPLRQVPPGWRKEILSAARQAVPPQHALRTTLHSTPSLLSALLWPRPAAWAGLAAAWLVILGLNIATHGASARPAKHASPLSPQVFMAFEEQQRLLTELIGPRETPIAELPKPVRPRPRSERQSRLLMA